MGRMPPGEIDLIFADPPFNIGLDYDSHVDKMADEGYVEWTQEWVNAAARILKPDGSMWVAMCDEYVAHLWLALKGAGLVMRNWVVWYYTFGVHTTKKFGRSHTHLLYFVKDPKDFQFNTEHIRIPSARQTTYNDPRAARGGKVPDNTWITRPQDIPDSFQPGHDCWYYPRVAGTHRSRRDHIATQMPERILERIILSCSDGGDLVLDPFLGSGTTVAVAKKLGREWIGIDLSKAYIGKARRRIDKVFVGDEPEGAPDPRTSAPKTPRK
jgi:site-specific DNA-methyltransferase (adenine-specific)